MDVIYDTEDNKRGAMNVIYDSEDYCIVEFLAPNKTPGSKEKAAWRSEGYEIVAKHLQRELFINGKMAEEFRRNVRKLIAQQDNEEEIDDFLGKFDSLMNQRVVLH